MTFYEWHVELLHARNAFAKRFNVEAENLDDAVPKAFKELERDEYDPGDFIVISAKRGAVTRRVSS